jgi:uncharacterized damage-inducible protein DinB
MAIFGIINLVKAATHPSKHPGGHELLASFPPFALASGRLQELRLQRGTAMKTPILSLICLACILNTSAVAMHAQTPNKSTDSTAPSYDMKAQALLDLQAVNKKCVDLAEALPSDMFTWRPSPDTRSFAEVFLHVAGERYAILSMMGANPPVGFKARELEKSTTEKDRIVEDLNQSWDFANKTITSMSNADFAKLLPKLGPQANEGDVVYILVVDAHEHLGQLIAYARQNGIVPPWTVQVQKNKAGTAASK